MIAGQSPSRREVLLNPLRQLIRAVARGETASDNEATVEPNVAIIQGRYCLAYRSLTCTTCYERCPEEDAVIRSAASPV